MIKCIDIIEKMEELAPQSLALEWDNVGLLLGNYEKNIKKILLALDINDDVLKEAILQKCDMIITHHPIIFKSIKKITTYDTIGRYIIEIIKNDICLFSAHTNLDICNNGLNDILFHTLELENKGHLKEITNEFSLGRIGDTKTSYTLKDFAKFVSEKLDVDIVRFVGDENAKIKKVALCGGASSDREMFYIAKNKGADVYITGDIRYHESYDAQAIGLNLIDATHFATENIVIGHIKKYLDKHFKDLDIYLSNIYLQPFKNYK
ncbi:MAG: Nif3-like dinuclear metal center hexameric protein [Defluviitaleaceae bacterium]|nr:Nif3-like dinuclear metal center hexameric protein [Defluviitaleaceae bacterium]